MTVTQLHKNVPASIKTKKSLLISENPVTLPTSWDRWFWCTHCLFKQFYGKCFLPVFEVVPLLQVVSKSFSQFFIFSSAVRHPQHTQTGSNSSTIAADSSNGVTNIRCCRYSCMLSWWWVEVPPETCRAVSRYK